MTTHAHRAHDRHEPEGVGMAEQAAWIDKHGDVWRLGCDGLMHTPETAPFPREHVERKWGPLRLTTNPRATAREDGGEGRG